MWRKFPPTSNVSSKYVAIIHCTTFTRSSLSCLLIPSQYSPFLNLLVFPFFTAFTCIVCNRKEILWGIMPIKSNISGLKPSPQTFGRHRMFLVHQCTKFHCERTHHKQVYRNKHSLHKFLLPEAVFCCSQTCNFCFDELSSWYISVPSCIVSGPTISKLEAQTPFNCLRLFVVVYQLVVRSFITLGIRFT